MNNQSIDINSVKIGSLLKVGKSTFTVVAIKGASFVAEQEFNGKKHKVTFPFSSFSNPHLLAIKAA